MEPQDKDMNYCGGFKNLPHIQGSEKSADWFIRVEYHYNTTNGKVYHFVSVSRLFIYRITAFFF